MAVFDSPISVLVGLGIVVLAVHVLPWLVDPYGMRNVPGPFLAKFSDLWLGRVAALGHRSEVVHQLHRQHGPLVRIAPNHVSVADPAALQVVYAHGNGALKSDFYDAFVSIRRGVFNTRDRVEHSRKRKIISHVFSQKSVIEFEPHIQTHCRQLAAQWDRLCASGVQGGSGSDGEGGWRGHAGRVWLDCLPWYNYLAFDIIGRLAFGRPFGMLVAARDVAPVALSATEVANIPAVQILNDRGEFSASLGVLPPYWRSFVRSYVPWFRQGGQAVKNLAGLAIMAVKTRLEMEEDKTAIGDGERADLLAKLMQGKDDEGKPMGREELTAEALTQLIAGSDTTSNSSCAITYYLAKNPECQRKLQAELDEALGPLDPGEDAATSFETVKKLPYLDAVINEGLRCHTTSGIGLPRIVPDGVPMTVAGQTFPPGTVLSVSSYTIHRDPGVWGDDVEEFRPERWFEKARQDDMQRTFNPFSYGPRACVGRNLASMELLIILSSVFRRYDIVLEHPEDKFDTREGFLRKPVKCNIGIKRRGI